MKAHGRKHHQLRRKQAKLLQLAQAQVRNNKHNNLILIIYLLEILCNYKEIH
jgi:hypothetical protein